MLRIRRDMPNPVHLILTPSDASGLALALSRAHRLYAGFVNARARQTGHLFQGRFGSVAMDEGHLMTAARYVALNPVRAGLVAKARDWPWSSVRAHLLGRDDGLVAVQPLLERAPRFADLIESQAAEAAEAALRRAETIGRPLGDGAFLEAVAYRLGRSVTPRKRGRKPHNAKAGAEKGEWRQGCRIHIASLFDSCPARTGLTAAPRRMVLVERRGACAGPRRCAHRGRSDPGPRVRHREGAKRRSDPD